MRIVCDKCHDKEVTKQYFDKKTRSWLGLCKDCYMTLLDKSSPSGFQPESMGASPVSVTK